MFQTEDQSNSSYATMALQCGPQIRVLPPCCGDSQFNVVRKFLAMRLAMTSNTTQHGLGMSDLVVRYCGPSTGACYDEDRGVLEYADCSTILDSQYGG